MFPRKHKLKEIIPSEMLTVYRGKTATIGVILTVCEIWVYFLEEDETLTVRIKTLENEVIWSDTFDSDDINDDGMLVFEIDDSVTAEFLAGRYILDGIVNDKVAIKPQPIAVKEV